MKRDNKIWRKAAVLLLAMAFLLTGCEGPAAEADRAAGGSGAAAAPETEETEFDAARAESAEEKEELVQVTADASGKVRKVKVQAELKGVGDDLYVRDSAALKNIRNRDGDEDFRQTGEELLWENRGADISYQGESEKTPEVGVKVSYYLDGEEKTPEEMAGESGKVRIRFEYSNEHIENGTKVPLFFATVLALDKDCFSDVKVKGGTCTSMGDTVLAAGYAIPGLKDALGLDKWKETEDLKIPESVEVTASAKDFHLDFTTTLVTGGLFQKLKKQTLQDGDDLAEALTSLRSASSDILSGISELEEGSGEFANVLKEYTDGAAKLSEGSKQLLEGMQSLSSNGEALRKGADELAEGLSGLNEAASGLDAQMEVLKSLGESPETKALFETAKQLKEVVAALSEGAGTLSEGVQAYTDGAKELAGGMQKLQKGAEALGTHGKTLCQGFDQLSEGIRSLRSGYETFHTEGISELPADELSDILNRLRRLRKEDGQLPSFSGCAEGTKCSVRYLIETAEIRK